MQINFGNKTISCKIVYYGPGMSGKTANLQVIHKRAPSQSVGEMVSIATETDRTLYFDYLPLEVGQVNGMKTSFQIYTVPGQTYYNATRKLVLQGVDGVVFVADSDPEKMKENSESWENLKDNLAEIGMKLSDIDVVIQYNKRDLPHAMSVSAMTKELGFDDMTIIEASAKDGKGVFDTIKTIGVQVVQRISRSSQKNSKTTRRSLGNIPIKANSAPVTTVPIITKPIYAVAVPTLAPSHMPRDVPQQHREPPVQQRINKKKVQVYPLKKGEPISHRDRPENYEKSITEVDYKVNFVKPEEARNDFIRSGPASRYMRQSLLSERTQALVQKNTRSSDATRRAVQVSQRQDDVIIQRTLKEERIVVIGMSATILGAFLCYIFFSS